MPTQSDIIQQLHIGATDPETLGSYSQVLDSGDIKVWHKNSGYDKDTIFSINYYGSQTFLKNMKSTVQIKVVNQYQFCNPLSFMNLAYRENQDDIYEMDAVLENNLYHDNVTPFLAIYLIQHFGISNPSPRYIEHVATGRLCSFY